MMRKIGNAAVPYDANGFVEHNSPGKHTVTFLTVGDVARRYRTSVNTIWRWARTRPEFPDPVKLGSSCTRWRLSDLETFEGGLAEAAR